MVVLLHRLVGLHARARCWLAHPQKWSVCRKGETRPNGYLNCPLCNSYWSASKLRDAELIAMVVFALILMVGAAMIAVL